MNVPLQRSSTRTSHRLVALMLMCAALVTFASGCASLPFASHNSGPAGPATVAGQVTDDHGAILADASVRLSGPASRSVRTDTTGRFTFDRIPLGRYVVSASAEGFKSAKQVVEVDKEAAVRVDLRLRM
jgi:hypothetical protein